MQDIILKAINVNKVYPQRYYFVFGLCFFLIAVILPCLFITEHPFTYLLVFVLFVVTAIPFIIAATRDSFDLFEVINVSAFLYFLYFGIRTIYLLNTPEELVGASFFVKGSVDRALLYTITGFGVLLLGYYSRLPVKIINRLPELNFNPGKRRIIHAIIVLYIIGTISRGYFFLEGRQLGGPATNNLIDYFYIFCQWSLILAVIHYFSERKTAGASFFLWFIFLPVEVFFTFLRAVRWVFLPILFAPFMGYHYLKKRIVPFYLVIPPLIMFLISPVVNILKSMSWQGLSPKFGTFLSDGARMYTEISINLKSQGFSEYLQNSYHEIMNRFHGIDSLTTVIAYTPEAIDFQYGKTIFATIGFLIPQVIRENTFLRFLDTDILSLGRRVGGIYYGAQEEITGVAITQIGELYLNFHIFGIIIGMFILGIFYRTFYLYFIKKNPHPFSLFIYIILWFWVGMPEFWFIAYENFLKQLVLLLMICWYLNGGRLFRRNLSGPSSIRGEAA